MPIFRSLKPALDAAAAAQSTADAGYAYGVAALTTANGKVGADCGHNAVGSFCFARYVPVPGGLAAGATVAGSTLAPASVQDNVGVFALMYDGALAGTWRCLGFIGQNYPAVSLFQRIA